MEKVKFEIKRKVLHVIVGLFFIFSIKYDIIKPFDIFVLLLSVVFLSLISRKINVPLWSYFINNFEREEFKKKYPGKGLIFLIFGVLATYKLFEKNIALASISILTFMDSFVSVFGVLLKEKFNMRSKEKLILVELLGFVIAFFSANIFVSPVEALIAAFGAILAEYYEIEVNKSQVDDNFIVPLAAASSIVIFRKLTI